MHACMQTHLHPSIHPSIHSFIHSYIHTYPSIHTYISIHPSMHACIHTYIHAYIHTCIHAYMHTYIHTYTYIYTYTLEYIFHTHCTLLIHMKHGETALEHHRARLRKRHKSRCPRYTSSTVCPRCLMMFFFADQQIWRWSSRQSLHAVKLQKAAAFPSSHRNYFQTPLKLALSKLSESWRQVPRSRLFTPFPLYFDHLVFSALEVHSHLHALMSRHEQTLGKKLFQMETRTSSWTVEFSQLDSLKKWEEMNMILIYFN